MLMLSFFLIGTFSDAERDFNPLGRGVYLPKFNLLGNLHESGSQVCCNVNSCLQNDIPTAMTHLSMDKTDLNFLLFFSKHFHPETEQVLPKILRARASQKIFTNK